MAMQAVSWMGLEEIQFFQQTMQDILNKYASLSAVVVFVTYILLPTWTSVCHTISEHQESQMETECIDHTFKQP